MSGIYSGLINHQHQQSKDSGRICKIFNPPKSRNHGDPDPAIPPTKKTGRPVSSGRLIQMGSGVCMFCQVTIWLFNIAMENDPFIDDFPSYKPPFIVDFPWLC